MKSFVRNLIPHIILKLYHYALAKLAAFRYGYPSRQLIVVGVTGTGGKSSTVFLLSKLLEAAGWCVGATSTLFFKIGKQEKLNDKKMTMLGRFQTQKMLRQMVQAGCQTALVETTSQGVEQYRHLDIDYDIAVLTNLYPEHLEAHGGFENYKKAKGKLFAALSRTRKKALSTPKTIIVNGDDEQADYFLSFLAERKISFSADSRRQSEATGVERITASDISLTGKGIQFSVAEFRFAWPLLGRFNLYNILCAMTIAQALGVSWGQMQKVSQAIGGIPGRLEFIEAGQPFQIIVDYAFEPKALGGLYEIIQLIPHQKIVHVLGSAGGGRDKARRPLLGELAGKMADYVIITDEDPYDEDPRAIIDQVAAGALASGKKESENLFRILDRRAAIGKALSLAQKDDLVIITGKGSEQAICVKNGKKIPWDDQAVVREEVRKIEM